MRAMTAVVAGLWCASHGLGQYQDEVLGDGPVAYWRLADGPGGPAADAAGGFDGAYGPGVDAGVADDPLLGEDDGSAAFPGAPGGRVTVPYDAALNPVTGLTVEVWAKPDGGSGFQAVISSREDPPGGGNSAGYIIYAGPADNAPGLRWQFWAGGSLDTTWNYLGRNRDGFALGPPVAAGVWTHVVGVLEITGPADADGLLPGDMTLYVNGEPSIEQAGITFRANEVRDLFIGAGQNEAPDNFWFAGGIDEVAVYDRALSGAEVAAHYTAAATVIGAWAPIAQGVDLAKAEGIEAGARPVNVNVLRIALGDPAIGFFTTPSNGPAPLETAAQTASQFLVQFGMTAAVNASFFSPCCAFIPGEPKDVIGLAISEGGPVSPAVETDKTAGSAVLVVGEDGAASVVSTTTPFDPAGVDTAVAGSAIIVLNGENVGAQHSPAYADPTNPNPRTCAGVSADGAFLYLMTIDGRQPGVSEGSTMLETARWLLRFGVHDGLNLDGGGSTTMVVDDGAGGAELVNDPVNNNVVDLERFNGNHVGVAAPALPDCGADLDGSGVIDSPDLNTLLAGFGGPGGPAMGDLDGDGLVGSSDLNVLLAAFGSACR